MSDQSDENKSLKGIKSEILLQLFEVGERVSLLLWKTAIVLNCGALALILVSLSRIISYRSLENNTISRVLIESSVWFGIGLTAAIFGLIVYTPTPDVIEELKEYYEQKKSGNGWAAVCILLSLGVFLYGVWKIINNLDQVILAS
ncbi:MAG: hypothetical protein OXF89_05855 [Rhodospirillaceae bacterium]|nr:hypothetical protein [Rhodospirillaceae bacterium]